MGATARSPLLLIMSEFSNQILAWYDQHARVLPWREHADPYAVWVSEIMLQQTRVETVIPYFERWMKQFPTIEALALTSQQTVLSAWEGLGYYSRCRNLHKAAIIVMQEYGGQLPVDINLLRKLPGIGRYTSSAIASIAFNQDVATLDGNLRRVFARVFDISTPADSQPGEQILWDLAQAHLPLGRAGDYNQALMDLGSAVCLPRKPNCPLCPLRKLCLSSDHPQNRPVLKPKIVVPHKLKMAAVILRDEQALLAIHPSGGLLGGLWEFPAGVVNTNSSQSLADILAAEYSLKVQPLFFLVEVNHAYTHFTLTEYAWRCELISVQDSPLLKWVAIADLPNHPMGKVDRTIAKRLLTDFS
jgi:A/G-specific adenine glycosylase